MLAIKMIDDLRELLSHLNADYAVERSDIVEVIETAAEGAGTARFEVVGSSLHLRPCRTHQVVWLKERKCADGAIITFSDDGARIHVVELKSGLSYKKWVDVKSQFEGMYLNALALSKFLGINNVVEVVFYIAFSNENLTKAATASPILLKRLPKELNIPSVEDWNSSMISMPNAVSGRLVKGQRGPDGNVDFGKLI